MANPRIFIFSKKVIRTNTENSVEVGLFLTSLIHSFSFVYSYKFYLYQYVHIHIVYIHVTFCLKLKKANNVTYIKMLKWFVRSYVALLNRMLFVH